MFLQAPRVSPGGDELNFDGRGAQSAPLAGDLTTVLSLRLLVGRLRTPHFDFPTEILTVQIQSFRRPSTRRTTICRTVATCGLALALLASASTARAQTPAAATATPAKPVAVVAISSYQKLLADVDFIGALVGMPGVSQMVDGQLTQMTGGKGLAGFDKSRPIGVLVDMSQMFPNFAGYLPVTDLPALLEVLKPLQITSVDAGNGVQQITANGQDVYAKGVGAWTLIGMNPAGMDSMPPDPSETLGPLTKEYDAAIQINMQSLPPAMKQQGLAILAQQQQNLPKLENESDSDYAARQQAVGAQVAETTRVLNELDAVTVGLAIAGEEQKVYLDVLMSALPGSTLATQFAEGAGMTTNFAGFAQEGAAVTAQFSQKINASHVGQLESGLTQIKTEALKGIERHPGEQQQALREALDDILAAIRATAEGGQADGGATVMLKPGASTVVIGGLITEPAKIESALKKAHGALGNQAPPVSWAAATHGGVTFHTMSVPSEKEPQKAFFGDNIEIVVGLGPKAVYLAVGAAAGDALKAVVDGSAAAPASAVKPFDLSVSVAKVLAMVSTTVEEADRAPLEAAAGAMATAPGKDKIHMFAQSTDSGMQMRLEIEQGVLKAIAQAGMMQAMGGAGGPGPAGPPPGAGAGIR
jgi:hypothetical protein